MSLSRRRLLVSGAIAAATGALAPVASFAGRVSKESQPDLRGWPAVRAQFDLDPAYTHLGLFYLTSHPRPVRASIERFRQLLDRNPFLTVEQGMFDPQHHNLSGDVVGALGRYTGLDPQDIAPTSNTTTGLSIIYHGLPLKSGDEILTTTHDHYVHHEAIRFAAERAGATWRRIPLFNSHDSISEDDIVDRIRKGIGPKTRVLGVTWVHSSSGLKLPIRRIAATVAEVNKARGQDDRLLLVVDGVHGLGVEDPKIATLGADAFAAGLHKWIFAPRGTGFVWAKPEVWATMRPLIPSFLSGEEFLAWEDDRPPKTPLRAAMFAPGGFQSFEHHWAVPAAIEFHEQIGPSRITDRIHALNAQMREGLAKMPHVVVYTPAKRELSAGLVCFDVKGMKSEDIVQRLLAKKIVASTTPYKIAYARLACGIMNTPAEVDQTLAAIRALG